MSGSTDVQGGQSVQAEHDFFAAVEAGNIVRVRQLLATATLQASDLTEALDYASPHLELMRCLLEHGADASAAPNVEDIRSLGVLKLLVEFEYDIRSTGHLFIQ